MDIGTAGFQESLPAAFGVGAMLVLHVAAVQAALSLGNSVRGAFDLFRSHLLSELRVALPASIDAERKLWEGQLNHILLFADRKVALDLKHPDRPKPAKDDEPVPGN